MFESVTYSFNSTDDNNNYTLIRLNNAVSHIISSRMNNFTIMFNKPGQNTIQLKKILALNEWRTDVLNK